MHPITDNAVVAYAQRMGIPVADARKRAESMVSGAVEKALRGDLTAFDQLREFEQIARARWRERVEAGESQALVTSGGSGLPLAPSRGRN